MKKRRNKKGFTLVELLVVIGIIAVLAVVSVVGYFGFIKKANLSNDQSSITQMNLGLQADAVDKKDGKYTYAGDAVQALYSQGWNKGKMEPYSSNYKYAYSIDNNKMYLLDEGDNVVFPDSKVDKSTLWGFYFNSVNKIEGITRYIAMDNITNLDNFESQVGNESYTFDLNGYFIGLEKNDKTEYSNTNVTIQNGILVKGTFTNGNNLTISTKYEVPTLSDEDKASNKTGLESGKTYENMVFSNYGNDNWTGKTINGTTVYGITEEKNVTFKNCYFYNSSFKTKTIMNFENCYFIDGYKSTKENKNLAALEIYYDDDNVDVALEINIKNCTFTNTNRAINYQNKDKDLVLNVENCTFNGVADQKYAALQITLAASTINFKNNTINSLGNATTIVRFHENYFIYGDTKFKSNGSPDESFNSKIDQIVFSNNMVSNKISKDNYIDLDEFNKGSGSKTIDKITYTRDYTTFYNAAYKKFADSVATI